MVKSSSPESETPAVVLSGVQFSYTKHSDTVLDIDNWTVARGQRTFLYGASGSGKTTLLNLLSGVNLPTAGTVEILGEVISAKKAAERDRFRANHIGVIFQQFNLIPWLSVRDNIAAAHHFSEKKLTKTMLEKRIGEILERLGLSSSLLDRKTAELSVGQQQRVAISRALINEPELLVADEPTSALDSNARDEFIELLIECVSSLSSTLIFVSHDKSLAQHFDKEVDLQTLNKKARVIA